MGFVSKVSRSHSWERETWAARWQGALRPPGGTARLLGPGGWFVCVLSPQRWVILFSFSCRAGEAGSRSRAGGGGGLCPGLPWWPQLLRGDPGEPPAMLGRGEWASTAKEILSAFFWIHFLQRCFQLKRNMKYAVTHWSFLSWKKALTWYESLTLTLLGQTLLVCVLTQTDNNQCLYGAEERGRAAAAPLPRSPSGAHPALLSRWTPSHRQRDTSPVHASHSAQHGGGGTCCCCFPPCCGDADNNNPTHLLLTLPAVKLTYRWYSC